MDKAPGLIPSIVYTCKLKLGDECFVILVLGGWRQEDQRFKITLSYKASPGYKRSCCTPPTPVHRVEIKTLPKA